MVLQFEKVEQHDGRAEQAERLKKIDYDMLEDKGRTKGCITANNMRYYYHNYKWRVLREYADHNMAGFRQRPAHLP